MNNYIGTEHLLLALTNKSNENAARVLAQLSLPAAQVRDAVMQALKIGSNASRPIGEAGKS
jgi:ATP-dependent Clp protease ATP-binding subunit ClpA